MTTTTTVCKAEGCDSPRIKEAIFEIKIEVPKDCVDADSDYVGIYGQEVKFDWETCTGCFVVEGNGQPTELWMNGCVSGESIFFEWKRFKKDDGEVTDNGTSYTVTIKDRFAFSAGDGNHGSCMTETDQKKKFVASKFPGFGTYYNQLARTCNTGEMLKGAELGQYRRPLVSPLPSGATGVKTGVLLNHWVAPPDSFWSLADLTGFLAEDTPHSATLDWWCCPTHPTLSFSDDTYDPDCEE